MAQPLNLAARVELPKTKWEFRVKAIPIINAFITEYCSTKSVNLIYNTL